ncbi:MAG: thiamine biosynthesis protein ThiS [Candidatus Deianiraeaceae bacterium]|jgi:thiamine biosynthesis protein ThiS
MQIKLNGKDIKTNSKTLGSLIQEYNLSLNKIAIEYNGEVIPKSQLDNYIIQSNSSVEIITFVGGG